MKNPVKLIYKYKNLNRRVQYQLFVFVGFNIPENIKKILLKIEKLNFYDSIIKLEMKEIESLIKYYDNNWYKKLFTNEHLLQTIIIIDKSEKIKNDLKKKMGEKWLDNFLKKEMVSDKIMYNYEYLYKKEITEKNKKLSQNKIQKGGGDDENEPYDDEELLDNNIIDENLTYDDNDEYDLEELENLYRNDDIDTDAENTKKLINEIVVDTKKTYNNLINFPNDKDNLMYDDSLNNLFVKNYVFSQYIFEDDTIKKIKEKICAAIKLNSIFCKNDCYLIPSSIYLWTKYSYIDHIERNLRTDKIMLGQKWLKKNSLLNISIEPNDNLKIYEDLRGDLLYLKQDFKKIGSRIKREEDEFKLLEDYEKYIENNEIYMIDIYNDLGLNYELEENKIKNLFDIYIRIYYSHINSDSFKQILNFLNTNNSNLKKDEISLMNSVFTTINNDLIIENEIIKTLENIDLKKSNIFKNNYITHTVIHSYIIHTNIFNFDYLDLHRIWDNFETSEDYPFVQYQLHDGKFLYKFYTKTQEKDENAIKAKWFENSPYGVSFKVRTNQKGGSLNKYLAINLFETGRLEYKIQWKEDDLATFDDIQETYTYIINIIKKINSENIKMKLEIPKEEDFSYAFINSIQKVEFEGTKTINHNDLSDFCRNFYPFVSLVIEPRKRTSESGKISTTSKYGTYLRYKRVSKFENEAKVKHRIIHFIKNYEYTEISLIKEIAKQFNLSEKKSAELIEEVKTEHPVIKKSRKELKKLESAPKNNHPGIDVNIQGRSRLNYKIRISGARNKNQLNRIVTFMNKLIYLYIETYLNKNKQYSNLKDKLKSLTNIAKRRNKVEDVIMVEDKVIKDVKKLTKFDSDRLGYRPDKGESHWTRSCQNSGKKKRQPKQHFFSSINEMLQKGYKYNDKTKYYERKVKDGKKEVVLRAAELFNSKDKGNNLYYVCDPEENGEYMHVGFLQRSKNPNDLCMPCCFKKDPLDSTNKSKKDYYLKCMNKIDVIEDVKKNIKTDKIYILQDTNKIQEGRFSFLPEILDKFLNKVEDNNNVEIKNHYLIKTLPSYYFKLGVKISNYQFLECISSIYDKSVKDIIEIVINNINDNIFISLNSGELKLVFENIDNYKRYLKEYTNIEFNYIYDIISKPGILTKNGINYYIFEKNVEVKKNTFEKKEYIDNFNLLCNNQDDNIFKKDIERDNLIILKDKKIYYPIFLIEKKNDKTDANLKKIFKMEDSVIKKSIKFNDLTCSINFGDLTNKNILFSCKYINYLLRNTKFKITTQIIDNKFKCRYIVINDNILLPTFPSGTIHDIKIELSIDKYLKNIDETVKNLLMINNEVKLNLIPIGFLYSNFNNDKFNFVAFLFDDEIELRVKSEFISENKIKEISKKFNKEIFIKKNISEEEIINKFIINNNFEIDDRIKNIKKKMFENESYELFRLEFSNFINQNNNIKDKIIKIIDSNKLNKNEKNKHIQKIIYKNISKDIYDKLLIGGDNKFVNISDNNINFNEYNLNNKRHLCSIHQNKDDCNSNHHCKFVSNKCLFNLSTKKTINFVSKIIDELLSDEMKSKELLKEDNYFISDIVDQNNYIIRKNEKIIKSNNPDIEKILTQYFGNIPFSKNKKGIFKNIKTLNENILENPLEEIGDYKIQNIIMNNYSIIRAFVNSYYWKSNDLKTDELRNLKFYSELQTNLTNYFIGKIIDFINNNTNKEYLQNTFSYLNFSNFDSIINDMNNLLFDGRIILCILSKILNETIIIYDNYFKVIYICKDGKIIYDIKYNIIIDYKSIVKEKNQLAILFEYNFNSNNINKIKSIYF
jgi:hypothetical protein